MTRGETAERLAALLYPRRCPFCGVVLGPDAVMAAVCPDCAAEERRLAHTPPRLPATEHVLEGLTGAAGAYYYADAVRHAILLCKEHARPWYARELADLALARVFGTEAARGPGRRPQHENLSGLPLYTAIVPVPPREPTRARTNLPALLARRLGAVLGIPVQNALQTTRRMTAQKTLDYAARLRNVRGGYAVRPGVDLSGARVLLVDDIITTGATVSACALALQQGGAAEVFALCIAATEELPKEKQKRNGKTSPQEKKDP